MKKILLLLILLAGLFCGTASAYGGAFTDMVAEEVSGLDFSDVDAKSNGATVFGKRLSMGELVKDGVLGKLDLSFHALLDWLSAGLFGEIKSQIALLRQMIVILLLSAILKNLNASFCGKSVGELGFYVCYMVLIASIASTFYRQIAMVSGTLTDMQNVFYAMVPIFITLAATAGAYAQSAIMGPAIFAGTGLLIAVLNTVVLPGITLATSLEMVNQFSEKPMLGRFTALLKSGLAWGMKGGAFVYMTILSLQKISSSSMNQMVGKTAKAAVDAIPVIGGIMGGAVDAAAAMGGLLRGSTLVAAVIVLLALGAIPLLKLFVMILLYKITAAVAEPLAESRLVKCISAAGDFSVLLFGALFLAEVAFLFAAMLLLILL